MSKRMPNEDVLERRRLEDESPRLRAVVPHLRTIRLELSEARSEARQIESTHIRRIVLEHAPSVFMIACGEPRCRNGSYDLTTPIILALQRGETRIEADDTCRGDVGSAPCGRLLRCIVVAEYEPR